VHEWEHLLVSPDHRVDDGTPKVVELVLIHVEAWPHFSEHLFTPSFRAQSEVPAQLTDRHCLVHLLQGTIGLFEEWLRISRNRFCNGSHVYPPSTCNERESISGK
jgi:hypothetical protein